MPLRPAMSSADLRVPRRSSTRRRCGPCRPSPAGRTPPQPLPVACRRRRNARNTGRCNRCADGAGIPRPRWPCERPRVPCAPAPSVRRPWSRSARRRDARDAPASRRYRLRFTALSAGQVVRVDVCGVDHRAPGGNERIEHGETARAIHPVDTETSPPSTSGAIESPVAPRTRCLLMCALLVVAAAQFSRYSAAAGRADGGS